MKKVILLLVLFSASLCFASFEENAYEMNVDAEKISKVLMHPDLQKCLNEVNNLNQPYEVMDVKQGWIELEEQQHKMQYKFYLLVGGTKNMSVTAIRSRVGSGQPNPFGVSYTCKVN